MKLLLDACVFLWITQSPALAARARLRDLTMVAPDKVFSKYGLRVIW